MEYTWYIPTIYLVGVPDDSNAISSMFQSGSLGLPTASTCTLEGLVEPPERGGPPLLPPPQGPAGGAAASESARGTTTFLTSPSAPAAGSGAGKDAALVTNLGDKSMATGHPPAQAFLSMFS